MMACEYCNNDKQRKPIHGTVGVADGLFAAIVPESSSMWLDFTLAPGCLETVYAPIRFCPMCGEKLGDTNE